MKDIIHEEKYYCKNCRKELLLEEIFERTGNCPYCFSYIGFFGYFTYTNEKGKKEKAEIEMKNVKLKDFTP